MDLEYLLGALDDDPRLAKYAALNRALVGLVDDYSHVRFQLLSITVCDEQRQGRCGTRGLAPAGCRWALFSCCGLATAATVGRVWPGIPLTAAGASLVLLSGMHLGLFSLVGRRLPVLGAVTRQRRCAGQGGGQGQRVHVFRDGRRGPDGRAGAMTAAPAWCWAGGLCPPPPGLFVSCCLASLSIFLGSSALILFHMPEGLDFVSRSWHCGRGGGGGATSPSWAMSTWLRSTVECFWQYGLPLPCSSSLCTVSHDLIRKSTSALLSVSS